MKIYFGHPINTYDTKLELLIIAAIHREFPNAKLVNPNQIHHQYAFQRCQGLLGDGMKYFLEEVLPGCEGGVFLPFRDGLFGAGVAKEALVLLKEAKPIWSVTVGDDEITFIPIKSQDQIKSLTLEETLLRLENPY